MIATPLSTFSTSTVITNSGSSCFIDTATCWFETKREQSDGCGKDLTYIKVFLPTASMDDFVEVVTPQIYADWHGGEA